MINNYDRIASFYDVASRLVFGRAQVRAQTELLAYLSEGSRILIVGGGTGWILDALPKGHTITYVENSAQMIALAKKRQYEGVTFVHIPVEDFVTRDSFDYVLTGFLFDNFSAERAARVFHLLDERLANGGRWFFTDFQYSKGGRLWQRLLLGTMYTFFRLVCRVEAKGLVDMAPFFATAGYRRQRATYYYGGFIISALYCKNATTA
jgi:ubiquinone/menaquinone biosynthesis C-methylase UbiE